MHILDMRPIISVNIVGSVVRISNVVPKAELEILNKSGVRVGHSRM